MFDIFELSSAELQNAEHNATPNRFALGAGATGFINAQ
jgi:hypothetical protein